MSPDMINKLAQAWRLKGLELSSRYSGQGGDLVKAVYDECAEELEEWAQIETKGEKEI